MKARRENEMALMWAVRRPRTALLLSTALQTVAVLVLSLPARAQPAPGARPSGGTLVAGTAAIIQNAAKTTINQSSSRAAINWQSFDVGAQHTVQFNQPSSSAVTLNRVIGPDPSAIAGRIEANGQVVLVNQSGVMFYKGAQVNTAGLMVSAANISNQNFMAGRMAFEQPSKPNARVENQGSITIKDAGIAALVAPQVANSGVINAKLGHVVLAGARTATLDLYGDGLLSINVTGQVTEAPAGPDGKAVTALVTNSGAIFADGGTVQLTARAADGVIQNLVNAGGTIRTATVGGKAGSIALNGVGGSIVVEGQLSAPGTAPGTKGGTIEIATGGNVAVGAGATIDASGQAGGGVVALGTTRARARGGPSVTPTMTAKSVAIAARSAIAADATARGSGGSVTVLSTDSTSMAGTVTARGGPSGGDGGFVEISGKTGFSLSGLVDVSAPLGKLGTILLDPDTLTVVDFGPNNPGAFDNVIGETNAVLFTDQPPVESASTVSNAALNRLTGNILLQANNSITIDLNTPITLQNNANLTFETKSGNILLNAGSPIAASGTGTVTMHAGLTKGSGGAITLNSNITTTTATIVLANDGPVFVPSGSITLQADGGITLNAVSLVTKTLDIANLTSGAVTQIGGGITAQTLQSSLGVTGPVDLRSVGNTIGAIGDFSAGSSFLLTNNGPLTVAGVLTGSSVSLAADSIDIPGVVSDRAVITGGPFGADGGVVTVNLLARTGGITETGSLIAGTLSGSAGTSVSLTGATPASNQIGTLAGFTAPAGFSLNDAIGLSVAGAVAGGTSATITDSAALTIGGSVSATQISLTGSAIAIPGTVTDGGAGAVALIATSGSINETGSLIAGNLTANAPGGISLTGSANQIARLGSVSTDGVLALIDASRLTVDGTVSAASMTLQAQPGIALGFGVPGDVTPGALVVPAGGRISLVTDTLDVLAPSRISAPGGTLEFVPFTLGSPEVVSQATPTDLVITPDALAAIGPLVGTLRFGRLTGEAAPRAGSIFFAAPTDFTTHAQVVELDTTGTIGQAPGALVTAATLTGQSGQTVTLTEANRIATLRGFSVTSGDFALNNSAPLTLGGLLSAPNVQVSATGQMTLAGDIATTGAPLAAQGGPAPAASGSFLSVQPDGTGAARISQIGTGTITGLGGGTATLRLQLPASNGSMRFDGLEASTANLVLGTGSGTTTGVLRTGTLLVVGAGGEATLTGSVGGNTGPGAAAIAAIRPAANPAYTFNGCTIGAALCRPIARPRVTDVQITSTSGGLVASQLVPTGIPAAAALPHLFTIALPSLPAPQRQLTDPDVVPPNVSVLDY
jgi:filamentous hemagglutinin family protein